MARRGRVLPAAGLAAVAVTVLLAGPWFWAEHRLSGALADWTARAQAAGWSVTYGAPRRTGWPLEAALDLPEPSASGPFAGLTGGVAWSAPVLRVSVSLLHPVEVVLRPLGTQTLRAGALPALAVTAAALSVALRPDGTARLEGTGLAAAGGVSWRAERVGLRLAPGPEEAPLGFGLDAAGLVLPGAWPFGDAVALLRAEGTLRGALPPSGVGSPAAALLVWRDGGGAVALDRFGLRWGPIDATGDAVLRLDEMLRPAGRADLVLAGWQAALDALRAQGVVGAGATVAARTVLGLMARTPAGGGASVVSLPVTVADGTLSVGHIPLLRLPDPVWPGVP